MTLYQINRIIEALEYSLELLNDQAKKGLYPEKALEVNGGKGYSPIIKALKILKEDDLT